MILHAIEVVLLFTFTSSDNFALLFYNLISFVQTYDPVYQNDKDTPEQIMSVKNNWYWTSSKNFIPTLTDSSLAINYNGGIDGMSSQLIVNQRPVLYLNDI